MITRTRVVAVALVLAVFASAIVFAQDRGRRGRRGGYGGYRGWDDRGIPEITDRRGTPDWPVDPHFKKDLFTFVRVKYRSYGGAGWATDWPDSDLNFPFRLQQLTSLKVDPNPKIVELTDDALFDYPFIYMIEPGGLTFSEEEVTNLRRYLLNGGFMMVDDFWGDEEWDNFYNEIKRVFPDREPQELDLSHPIFHAVYDLKEKPQMPSIHSAVRGDPTMTWERWGDRNYDHFYREVVKKVFPNREPVELPLSHQIFHCVYDLKEKPQIPNVGFATRNRDSGITSEADDGGPAHYRAVLDDKGRIMMLICHNTDLGDGWEEEATDPWYFKEFSEKKAYPLGINIIFYAMTH